MDSKDTHSMVSAHHSSTQLFARRCLDKVHELAQLEQQAAAPKTQASIAAFTEITIKVCFCMYARYTVEVAPVCHI